MENFKAVRYGTSLQPNCAVKVTVHKRRRVIDAVAAHYPAEAGMAERLVVLMLALMADQDGNNIRPSRADLAAQIGCHRDNMKRIFREILERGIVEQAEASNGSRWTYRFNPQWLALARPPDSADEAAPQGWLEDGRRCGPNTAPRTISLVTAR